MNSYLFTNHFHSFQICLKIANSNIKETRVHLLMVEMQKLMGLLLLQRIKEKRTPRRRRSTEENQILLQNLSSFVSTSFFLFFWKIKTKTFKKKRTKYSRLRKVISNIFTNTVMTVFLSLKHINLNIFKQILQILRDE